MRFVPDSPEIPNQLIRDWRAGKVLFLAGAGVSVPSGLPQFEELALRIYDSIGETMRPTLQKVKKHTSLSKREQIFDAASLSLSADKRAEADLFLDKQFDRFFSALEKRIDPDIKGRAKTRNELHPVPKTPS